jgi:hypothetical protein
MVKPPKKPAYQAPEKPATIIRRFIFKILGYPYSIIKKYNNYNIRVAEIVTELKDDELNRIRKNNGKLIMIFIYFPILLGLILSTVSIHSHYYDYQNYFNKINRQNMENTLSEKIGSKIKKAKIIVFEAPIRKTDFILIVYGYIFALLGARFLSINPIFKEEDKITNIFASLGYTDAEGKPWVVTWTPDAIMIVAFNCDPIQLCSNTRFWSTINFPPGTPKVSKNNMNKFIVTRAFELTPNMIFSFEDSK